MIVSLVLTSLASPQTTSSTRPGATVRFAPPPNLVTALLRNPAVRECVADSGSGLNNVVRIFPLHLHSRVSTVVVQGRIPCLAGNDNGSIFVYRFSGGEWAKILDVIGAQLVTSSTQTNHWRNLYLWQHDNAFRSVRHLYRFNGTQYGEASCNMVTFSDWTTGRRLAKPVYSSCAEELHAQ